MEMTPLILFVFIQLGILGFVAFMQIRGTLYAAKGTPKATHTMLIIDLILTVLMILCFLNYEMSSFNGEPYFPLFIGLIIPSIIGFWISKTNPKWKRNLQIITQLFVAVLCWLSFFTAIKFYPYYEFAWFPVLGIMAVAPILFTLMSLLELTRSHAIKPELNPAIALLAGLIFLFVLQLVLNFVTTDSWVLVKLFNPENTSPF